MNAELAFGQPTFYRNSGSSIIDLFITSGNFADPNIHIQDDLSLDSDHKLVHFTFTDDTTPALSSFPQPRRLRKLSHLRNSDIRDEYVLAFTNNIQPLARKLNGLIECTETQRPPPLTDLSSELYDAIYDALDNT
ncbi:hypothetical protein DFQ30_005717, partial [Apophysomyces sp. BC1015]